MTSRTLIDELLAEQQSLTAVERFAYAMVGVNVVVADTDAEAAFQFTSLQLRFLGMHRGRRGPLPRPIPVAELEAMWSPQERAGVERMLAASAQGGPDAVSRQLATIVERTKADELIVACALHDHKARLRSYELLASAVNHVGRVSAA